jgi:glycosyltransferase involved in cell wall biosynthesis
MPHAIYVLEEPKTLSVIVPAYNEAGSIVETIRNIEEALSRYEFGHELIIVDDGSTDETFDRASSVAKTRTGVRVLSYRDNNGKGHALKHGFQSAKGDLVLFLDADSDLPPSQVPLFLERMGVGDVDVVIGSKRHRRSKVDYPATRRLFSRAYSLLVKVLFQLDISDTQTGIKLFKRKVLDDVFPKVLVKKYAYDLELLVNARRLGYRVAEMPVVLNYRFQSRIKTRAVWDILLDTIAIFYRMRIVHYYDI